MFKICKRYDILIYLQNLSPLSYASYFVSICTGVFLKNRNIGIKEIKSMQAPIPNIDAK